MISSGLGQTVKFRDERYFTFDIFCAIIESETNRSVLMRIAIVDDNKTEQERLSALIRAWAQDEAVITETFDSGEAFAEALQRNRYEIVWMDIIMDGKNGIETARRLREHSMETLLIFITSSPEFMAQAFPCHAFDYVMKPYAPQRVFEVLEIAGDKFLLSDIMSTQHTLVPRSDNWTMALTASNKRNHHRMIFLSLVSQLELPENLCSALLRAVLLISLPQSAQLLSKC